MMFKVSIQGKQDKVIFSDTFITTVEAKDLASAFAKAVSVAQTMEIIELENDGSRKFRVDRIEVLP
jgi:hypothetical protein